MPRRAVLVLIAVSLVLAAGGATGLAAGLLPVRAGSTAVLTADPTPAPGALRAEPSTPTDLRATGQAGTTPPTEASGPSGATDAGPGTRPVPADAADATVRTRSARLAELRTSAAASPVGLHVPALGVSAPIDPVGVDPDGTMELPEDVQRLGWYRYGAAPGDGEGSVVVSGHVDSREQGPGVLFELDTLDPGARVDVQLDDGTTRSYEVVGRERIHKQALPIDRIFRRDGPEVLALLTCGGPFDASTRSYRDNVLVVAEPLRR